MSLRVLPPLSPASTSVVTLADAADGGNPIKTPPDLGHIESCCRWFATAQCHWFHLLPSPWLSSPMSRSSHHGSRGRELMEETLVSLRKPLSPSSPPPTPSSAPAFDLDRKQGFTCSSGGGVGGVSGWGPMKAGGTPSAIPSPASPGGFGAFCGVWAVVACLTFPTLVFVSGAYRPPMAFFSSINGHGLLSSQQRQHQ